MGKCFDRDAGRSPRLSQAWPTPAFESIEERYRELYEGAVGSGFYVAGQAGFGRRIQPPLAYPRMWQLVAGALPALWAVDQQQRRAKLAC